MTHQGWIEDPCASRDRWEAAVLADERIPDNEPDSNHHLGKQRGER
jgi:hypothetical protein